MALVLIAAFTVALQRTDWGVAMRAAAADGRTAALMGIRLSRVAAGAWALAGALAAVAGVFFTSFPSAGVDTHDRPVGAGRDPRRGASAGWTRWPARSSAA